MTENRAAYWCLQSDGRIQARYISPYCVILHQHGIYPLIGTDTWIGHWTVIDGSGGLTIGHHCSIASGVHIYTHSTHDQTLERGSRYEAPVQIGNHVVIGANAVIHYGTTIEDYGIVKSLELVTPYATIQSSPSTPIPHP